MSTRPQKKKVEKKIKNHNPRQWNMDKKMHYSLKTHPAVLQSLIYSSDANWKGLLLLEQEETAKKKENIFKAWKERQ